MIATIAIVALGATVTMIFNDITARLIAPRTTTVPSTWTLMRQAVREGQAPRRTLLYGMWRLVHPSREMKFAAAVWAVLVLLGIFIVTLVQLIAAETGWPFPVVLFAGLTTVTVHQFISTSRRIGRRGALRIAPFDVLRNIAIPLSMWAIATLIGAFA